MTPSRRAALALAALAGLILAGAWAFQFSGYPPCDLCLKQRWPYYLGIPLGLMTAALPAPARRAGLAGLAVLFVGSALFGGYHAGVEWGFWPGPADCTGPLTTAPTMEDFMRSLQSVHVVRCDAAALRILGLSLAGWNALLSLALAALAGAGARRTRTFEPPPTLC